MTSLTGSAACKQIGAGVDSDKVKTVVDRFQVTYKTNTILAQTRFLHGSITCMLQTNDSKRILPRPGKDAELASKANSCILSGEMI